METKSTGSRIFTWGAFIVIVALVVWGLIAAQQKASRDSANLVLPDQIVATDHVQGSTIAPVTLVEYGDFQCPACEAYHPLIQQVIASTSPDTLRFVFRHFPLTQHANAMPAALASEAASLQGKFWEMYNMLYENQEAWESSTDAKTIFAGYAKDMGLDVIKFAADYDLDSTREKITLDYKGGLKAGINSTPSFFINGKKITSPQNYDAFKKLIDDAATTTAR